MSSSDTFLDYLDDILQAIGKAKKFTASMNFQEFKKDEKSQFAVIRALEIMGEASNKIPKSIREDFEYIPWKEMTGMRNKLIHDYMGVNTEVVWNTIQKDLPQLQKLIEKMKRDLPASNDN